MLRGDLNREKRSDHISVTLVFTKVAPWSHMRRLVQSLLRLDQLKQGTRNIHSLAATEAERRRSARGEHPRLGVRLPRLGEKKRAHRA